MAQTLNDNKIMIACTLIAFPKSLYRAQASVPSFGKNAVLSQCETHSVSAGENRFVNDMLDFAKGIMHTCVTQDRVNLRTLMTFDSRYLAGAVVDDPSTDLWS